MNRLQQMLRLEKDNKRAHLSCISFYNKKIDEHTHITNVFFKLRDKAVNKVEGCNIQIDYIEREIEEENINVD